MIESAVGVSDALAILATCTISLALIRGWAEFSWLNDHAFIPGVSGTIGRVAHVEVPGRNFGVERGWLGIEPELHILCHGPATVEHGHDRIIIFAVAIIVWPGDHYIICVKHEPDSVVFLWSLICVELNIKVDCLSFLYGPGLERLRPVTWHIDVWRVRIVEVFGHLLTLQLFNGCVILIDLLKHPFE